ncbi:MAG TPA: hypothetical protein VEJ63_14245, partial [Planctomycetota bacterium]|nr:hypothetical protein [Planctomycetota bacterium]
RLRRRHQRRSREAKYKQSEQGSLVARRSGVNRVVSFSSARFPARDSSSTARVARFGALCEPDVGLAMIKNSAGIFSTPPEVDWNRR